VREANRASDLPILGNGPPGTFVQFPHGLRVSLPTDQVVFAAAAGDRVRIGFGGMRFDGERDGMLIFLRVREVLPLAQLSPARSHVMQLAASWVHVVEHDGIVLWPIAAQ
jgi:hypothetical protein